MADNLSVKSPGAGQAGGAESSAPAKPVDEAARQLDRLREVAKQKLNRTVSDEVLQVIAKRHQVQVAHDQEIKATKQDFEASKAKETLTTKKSEAQEQTLKTTGVEKARGTDGLTDAERKIIQSNPKAGPMLPPTDAKAATAEQAKSTLTAMLKNMEVDGKPFDLAAYAAMVKPKPQEQLAKNAQGQDQGKATGQSVTKQPAATRQGISLAAAKPTLAPMGKEASAARAAGLQSGLGPPKAPIGLTGISGGLLDGVSVPNTGQLFTTSGALITNSTFDGMHFNWDAFLIKYMSWFMKDQQAYQKFLRQLEELGHEFGMEAFDFKAHLVELRKHEEKDKATMRLAQSLFDAGMDLEQSVRNAPAKEALDGAPDPEKIKNTGPLSAEELARNDKRGADAFRKGLEAAKGNSVGIAAIARGLDGEDHEYEENKTKTLSKDEQNRYAELRKSAASLSAEKMQEYRALQKKRETLAFDPGPFYDKNGKIDQTRQHLANTIAAQRAFLATATKMFHEAVYADPGVSAGASEAGSDGASAKASSAGHAVPDSQKINIIALEKGNPGVFATESLGQNAEIKRDASGHPILSGQDDLEEALTHSSPGVKEARATVAGAQKAVDDAQKSVTDGKDPAAKAVAAKDLREKKVALTTAYTSLDNVAAADPRTQAAQQARADVRSAQDACENAQNGLAAVKSKDAEEKKAATAKLETAQKNLDEAYKKLDTAEKADPASLVEKAKGELANAGSSERNWIATHADAIEKADKDEQSKRGLKGDVGTFVFLPYNLLDPVQRVLEDQVDGGASRVLGAANRSRSALNGKVRSALNAAQGMFNQLSAVFKMSRR